MFFDSSALAKYYHREPGTEVVERLLAMAVMGGVPAYISRLAVAEFQSVFAKEVRTRLISSAEALQARNGFLRDIRERRFRVVALKSRHYEKTEKMIRQYGFSRALRTLDAVQLAVALDLKARQLTDLFVAADKALLGVAKLAGMNVHMT
mgnify:FL=1